MEPQTPTRHREAAAAGGPVPVGVITVSDSRTPDDDPNGRYLRDRILAAGHEPRAYRVVPDDPTAVAAVLEELAGEVRILLLNGGTGISRRDNTYEVVAARLEKTIPGFGELFRMLSFHQVGAAAMLSRAVGGLFRGSVVLSLPGSPGAVQLAWEELIEPELAHLAWEVGR